MGTSVLVAYATKHGATAGIADRIGEVLRSAGHAVTVAPVREAGEPSPFGAVVLGSAVYMGKWRKEAAAWLAVHERILAVRPVWLFSSGPAGQGDPAALLGGWRFPEDLQPFADRIRPRGTALFHGALDGARLNLAEKLAIKMVKAPYGDFRDWTAIANWAREIAASLSA